MLSINGMCKAIIFDLDGTVYRGNNEVPGASTCIRMLRERGMRILFVTNRSNRVPGVVAAQLRGYGIDCADSDVLTSAQATAAFLPRGSVYCIGEEGLLLALQAAGHTLTDHAPDVVIVGFDREFSYRKLEQACRMINAGARFVATNPDRALKLDDGLSPGTGAIVAAIQVGCDQAPLMIGKPERHIVDMALRQLQLPPTEVLMVGDNLDTDIAAGNAAGTLTALLLTGISSRQDAAQSRWKPTLIADTFAELGAILTR